MNSNPMDSDNNNKKSNISELMATSGVQFGTSGVRGLVEDMTDEVCFCYTAGFLQYLLGCGELQSGSEVGIAGDLRNSTERIMKAVAAAVIELGCVPVNFGLIPTPALALYGLLRSIPTIMVTGSHIPEDRNGIKFYRGVGEILKADEQGIKNQSITIPTQLFAADGAFTTNVVLPKLNRAAYRHYIKRFLEFFPDNCLAAYQVGIYEHSSVARECMQEIFLNLGAEVTLLGRSDHFVSVDTEAIRAEDVVLARDWSQEYGFDCIVSADGDGDRPLISDENGNWLRGDITGILCAFYLHADSVVTPVSSNTALEKSGLFTQVGRTRIGSPYVIAAMEQAQDEGVVVGYEANGGFLQGSDIVLRGRVLSALPTRDALIVPLIIMLLARQRQMPVSGLLDMLPQRYTASNRLKQFPSESSQSILLDLSSGNWQSDKQKIFDLFGEVAGMPVAIDLTDGLRISFENNEIIHLRPSGNAPELRCYNEAASEERVRELNLACMQIVADWR